MEPDAKLACERLEARERCRALLDINGGKQALRLELHDRGVLGRLHIVCALGCRPADQIFGRVEARCHRAAGSQLNQRSAELSA